MSRGIDRRLLVISVGVVFVLLAIISVYLTLQFDRRIKEVGAVISNLRGASSKVAADQRGRRDFVPLLREVKDLHAQIVDVARVDSVSIDSIVLNRTRERRIDALGLSEAKVVVRGSYGNIRLFIDHVLKNESVTIDRISLRRGQGDVAELSATFHAWSAAQFETVKAIDAPPDQR